MADPSPFAPPSNVEPSPPAYTSSGLPTPTSLPELRDMLVSVRNDTQNAVLGSLALVNDNMSNYASEVAALLNSACSDVLIKAGEQAGGVAGSITRSLDNALYNTSVTFEKLQQLLTPALLSLLPPDVQRILVGAPPLTPGTAPAPTPGPSPSPTPAPVIPPVIVPPPAPGTLITPVPPSPPGPPPIGTPTPVNIITPVIVGPPGTSTTTVITNVPSNTFITTSTTNTGIVIPGIPPGTTVVPGTPIPSPIPGQPPILTWNLPAFPGWSLTSVPGQPPGVVNVNPPGTPVQTHPPGVPTPGVPTPGVGPPLQSNTYTISLQGPPPTQQQSQQQALPPGTSTTTVNVAPTLPPGTLPPTGPTTGPPSTATASGGTGTGGAGGAATATQTTSVKIGGNTIAVDGKCRPCKATSDSYALIAASCGTTDTEIATANDFTQAGQDNQHAWLYTDVGAAHLAQVKCWHAPVLQPLFDMRSAMQWRAYLTPILYEGLTEELQHPLG